MLPRLVRLNGLFHVFYHNTSLAQYKALKNLLATAGRFDLWKPSLEEYAQFWERRGRTRVESHIDPLHGLIVANVTDPFDGLALSIRLPDGAVPGEVTIDGRAVEVASRQMAGIWYVYPVLPAAEQCRVVVECKQQRPSVAGEEIPAE